MASPPRVRFCPSPTGMFHVGGARTALFNWLFARQQGGTFVLRIEDTDAVRNRPEWTEGIYAAMRWLGLDWDESYPQTRNFEAHAERARKLQADGLAYFCGCTPDEVQARNREKGVKTPGYDGHCRDLDLPAGDGRALRFRTPREGTYTRVDVVRGTSEIDLATVDDFVILRANGTPLFVFANALDDLDDGITHVVRGEDHLSNVEKQVLLRRALGADEPVWAHLPLLVNEKRQKLSKRRDKVALERYREDGVLAEAMVNYLGTLGWSPPGDEELVPLATMLDAFRLEDVNRAGAQFDEKKLLAFNGHHLRSLPREQFVERALDWYRATVVDPLAEVIQERGATFPETLSMTDFLLHDAPPMDGPSWDKAMGKGPAAEILQAALETYGAGEDWTTDALHAATEELAGRFGLGLGKAQAPIRVAVTGRTVGPPLFESMVVLGRERTLVRLTRALARLAKP
ncbi:MAG TPA: glutamate--tRNA ligase [Acidimicrobiales bacterium]|nr:glutamate--tRNA ligase [Acidimicrobiales bacterium]